MASTAYRMSSAPRSTYWAASSKTSRRTAGVRDTVRIASPTCPTRGVRSRARRRRRPRQREHCHGAAETQHGKHGDGERRPSERDERPGSGRRDPGAPAGHPSRHDVGRRELERRAHDPGEQSRLRRTRDGDREIREGSQTEDHGGGRTRGDRECDGAGRDRLQQVADGEHPACPPAIGERADERRQQHAGDELHDGDRARGRRASAGVGVHDQQDPHAPLCGAERGVGQLQAQQRPVAQGDAEDGDGDLGPRHHASAPTGTQRLEALAHFLSHVQIVVRTHLLEQTDGLGQRVFAGVVRAPARCLSLGEHSRRPGALVGGSALLRQRDAPLEARDRRLGVALRQVGAGQQAECLPLEASGGSQSLAAQPSCGCFRTNLQLLVKERQQTRCRRVGSTRARRPASREAEAVHRPSCAPCAGRFPSCRRS